MNLGSANLAGADLRGAKLIGAKLFRADFTDAKLEKADFSKAFLIQATLGQTDQTKANFCGATMPEGELFSKGCSQTYVTAENGLKVRDKPFGCCHWRSTLWSKS
ncbi:MAG: pentapeptide repeat-containing protein [Verrucomicrobia bacterium]|nr:pentapeptide repeat-containing protein [Leptolyngbya sp. ES-bin-22]